MVVLDWFAVLAMTIGRRRPTRRLPVKGCWPHHCADRREEATGGPMQLSVIARSAATKRPADQAGARHCEERSDEAIQHAAWVVFWIASLRSQ
jgi:hypothetical protein